MDAKVKEWVSKVAEKVYWANVVPMIRKREWEDLNSEIKRTFKELSIERYGQDKYEDLLKSEFLQQEKKQYVLGLGNGFLRINRPGERLGQITPLDEPEIWESISLNSRDGDTHYCGYLAHRMRDAKADPWQTDPHSFLSRETIKVRMKNVDFLLTEEEFGIIQDDLDRRVCKTKRYDSGIDENITDLGLETQFDLKTEVVFFGTLGEYKRKLGVLVSEWAEKIKEIKTTRETAYFDACILLERYSKNGILREDLIENWPDIGQCLEIAEKLAEKWGTEYQVITGSQEASPGEHGEIKGSYISRAQHYCCEEQDKPIQDTRFLILYEKFIKHGVPLLKK